MNRGGNDYCYRKSQGTMRWKNRVGMMRVLWKSRKKKTLGGCPGRGGLDDRLWLSHGEEIKRHPMSVSLAPET